MKAFTLIELLIGIGLLCLILASLFMALNAADISSAVGLSKVDLQARVRQSLDSIIKDVRSAVSWEMANNNPSDTYIKFRQVQGWDAGNSTFFLSANYIEYSYDNAADRITRRVIDNANNVLEVKYLNNVLKEPFYTVNLAGNAIVPLNQADLLNSRRLVIEIASSSPIRGALKHDFSLRQEVKIRNE